MRLKSFCFILLSLIVSLLLPYRESKAVYAETATSLSRLFLPYVTTSMVLHISNNSPTTEANYLITAYSNSTGLPDGSPLTAKVGPNKTVHRTPSNFSDDNGGHSLVISSDQPLSVIVTDRDEKSGTVGMYLARPRGELDQYIGPYYSNPTSSSEMASSIVTVQNAGTGDATVKLTFLDVNGDAVDTVPLATVHQGASHRWDSKTLGNLVAFSDGIGWVKVTSDKPVVSIVTHQLANGQTVIDNALISGIWPDSTPLTTLPRLHRNSIETGAPISTSLFVGNPNNGAVDADISFLDASGVPSGDPVSISSLGINNALVSVEPDNLSDGIHSVLISSTLPLLAGTYVDDVCGADYSLDSVYAATAPNSIKFPGAILTPDEFSVITVMNPYSDSIHIDISLVDDAGITVHSTNADVPAADIPAFGSLTYDIRTVPHVPDNFYGSFRIVTSDDREVPVQIDLYARQDWTTSCGNSLLHLPIVRRR